jgi:type VI protein secretion system component VasF
LDAVVREQIRQTLIDELRGVHIESQRAVESLQRVQKAAELRVLWWSVGITALSAMVAAVVGYATTHV